MGVEVMSKLNLIVSAQEKLLTPSEVATLFRVDPKTVTRWAKAGKLTSIKTLGGHRRYRESEVKALLRSTSGDSVPNSSTKQIGENKI
jgi:excisionase family DNA binding protein